MPSDWIRYPAVDVGFMPAGPVGADFELSRERALGDLAVDGGPGQPGPGEHSFQADHTVWFWHGRAGSCSLSLRASETREDKRLQARKSILHIACHGVQTAGNRMDQIPMSLPLPRSIP